ncbi:MAG: hypothetical protein AB3X41_11845 [Leptothrix ochracea]|uniref:hypothetical protein n=1 Tax=Leptothrix ochracea TaxID=735331 RepID=UPI0034E28D97
MNIAPRTAIAFVAAIAASACSFELPELKSASVESYSRGGLIQSWALNESQRNALSSWFKQHQSGWSASYVSYAPAILVHVSSAHEINSVVNILPVSKVVVFNNSGQYEQKFDGSEFQKLLDIVTPVAANQSFQRTAFGGR